MFFQKQKFWVHPRSLSTRILFSVLPVLLTQKSQLHFSSYSNVARDLQMGCLMEARHVDIELLGEEIFFKIFGPGTVFFNLWRENIVAQAVSLYRAVNSGRYHSTDAAVPGVPPYDADQINKWLVHLQLQENANINILRKRGIIFDNLRYETMVKNREATLELFFSRLNINNKSETINALVANELQKVGDYWNEETEQRFRAERAESIAKFEASRLVRELSPKDISV
ncbi:Stf0 sulphotransferase [Acidocella aminolytica 101 = DSM 11237]|nr:Stf0 sulphotransferase [Acidocella aminolytica 101 = DSM 11237]